MRRGIFLPFLAIVVLATAARADASLDRARVVAGEELFKHACMTCHSPDPAKNAFGPSLIGVIGRQAGTVPRFAYSDAVKNSGIVWTEVNLRAWMSDNEALIPGTRMRHVSIDDPAEQDFLLAYIRSLKPVPGGN
jgi:cytochrome c